MKVSVVICTHSGERLGVLLRSVESVLRQTHRDVECIVIVDHNEELLRRLRDLLPEEVAVAPNGGPRGLSGARNAGVRLASGEIVAFLDDDAVADERWIEELLEGYRDPDVACVGGKALPLWEKGRPWWFPEELDWIVGCTHKGYPEQISEVRNVIGCNMSFRKRVFDRVGLFNPSFGRVGSNAMGGEETELCIRLRAAEPCWKVVFTPNALVSHIVPSGRCTFGYAVRRAYGEGISKAMIRRTLKEKDDLSTEYSYLRCFLSAPFRIIRGSWGLGGLVSGSGKWLAVLVVVAATCAGWATRFLKGRCGTEHLTIGKTC